MTAPKRMNIVLLACLALIQLSSAEDWTYSGPSGPSTWKERYPSCGGMRQSPINIDTNDVVVKMVSNNLKVKWYNYNKEPISMKLINNGHSVMLKATPNPGESPYLEVNKRVYELDQIHFHWGKKDQEGSEHQINNKRFPLEMHAVHRRTENGTQVNPPEIIVIALLYEISYFKNQGIELFAKYMPQVNTSNTEVEIPAFSADKIIPSFRAFYVYEGSLTTPPCSEVVTFAIRKELGWLSSNQMKLFRVLLNDELEELSGNFRPIQPTNKRTVYDVYDVSWNVLF